MNAEAFLVGIYNAHPMLDLEAFSVVPANRPPRFITVERVGGTRDTHRDFPLLSILVWGTSRNSAADDAELVATLTADLALTHPRVASVMIQPVFNNPDPSSKQARSQVTASMVVV